MADIQLGAVEPHLEREPVDPVMLARPAGRGWRAGSCPGNGAHALYQHQGADNTKEGDIAERYDQVDLADLP